MDYTKPFKYIMEIAKCQSISTAADNLNIQQPALSKYLKKVESELGVELFDRSATPIILTEAGKYYLATAKKIIDVDNQLHKQINEIQNKKINIKVGISHSRSPYLLPQIISDFRRKEKDAKITIIEGTSQELNKGIADGTLDLIISILDDDTKAFESIKLFDEYIFLAVPKVNKDMNFLEAVSNLNIISSGKGQLLTNILNAMPNHTSFIECQNIITAFELVREGIGATLVPSYLLDYGDSMNISYIKVPNEYVFGRQRTVCVFYRKEQFVSSTEKSFIDSCVLISKDKYREARKEECQ